MAYRTVKLKGDGISMEKVADGAITPGHLLQRTSADKLAVHASAAGAAVQRIFALEDEAQGGSISTAYTTATRVKAVVSLPGDQIAALVVKGAGVAIGGWLESAGDGTLRAYTAGDVVAVADETVAAGAGTVRAAVEIL